MEKKKHLRYNKQNILKIKVLEWRKKRDVITFKVSYRGRGFFVYFTQSIKGTTQTNFTKIILQLLQNTINANYA